MGSFIFACEGVVFITSEVKAELGEDRAELGFGHVALSQLVKVVEELLNAYAFHHNGGAEAVFNV